MSKVRKHLSAMFLGLGALVLGAMPLQAENNEKVDLHIDLANSLNSDFSGSEYQGTHFKNNVLRFAVHGGLTENISYSFRQALWKDPSVNSVERLANQIELANVTYRPSDKLALTLGKQFLSFGGWEHNVNILRIKEFSEFVGAIACWQTGVSAAWQLNDNHEMIFQLLNGHGKTEAEWYTSSLEEAGLKEAKTPLMALVNWNGYFVDKTCHFRYAASMLPVAQGKYAYYLTAANIYQNGPLFATLDVMYSREDVDHLGRLSALQSHVMQNVQYLSFIANVEYAFHPQWNAVLKGAYETTDVFKEADAVVPNYQQGRYLNQWHVQGGLEFMPIAAKPELKFYAWYVYKVTQATNLGKYYHMDDSDMQRVSLGMTYTIDVL